MIDWDRVGTVLLDMDGTLLDLAFDNRFWLEYLPARYASNSGQSLAAAEQDLFARMARVEGTLPWYCLDYWSRELAVDIAAIKQENREGIRYRDGAQDFLAALGGSGRQRLLVTNAHPQVLAIKLEQTGLGDYLDGLVTAHDYGYAKQDARFWDRLHVEQGIDPATSLLLDDSHAVLRAARQWGIAQVAGIARPDSTREPLVPDEFPLIDRFDAVAPTPLSVGLP